MTKKESETIMNVIQLLDSTRANVNVGVKNTIESAIRQLEAINTSKLSSAGTSVMGYIDAGYDELVRAFGKPGPGDGYKTDAEWIIQTSAGVATIYNYKDGVSYNGPSGTPTKKIREWHIGGHTKAVVALVQEMLKK